MPTPSIQTLTTDAQQVLNLDSISAVRSVVAVALANANTGTPLNPNLTTQQLWDQFYQVVTRPKSDIESIIANQLMKFLYSPPAPGGAGADKQVIFNDGGVLAGDADFLWNKTTNLLTVTGAATITGDLTVRTNKLFVNATGVGIGNTGPLSVLTISSQVGARLSVRTTDATFGTIAGGTAFDSLNDAGNALVPFGCRGSTVTLGSSAGIGFQIDASGNATWSNVGGVAGTAMTLNSAGLGVGVTPAAGDGSGVFKAAGTGSLTANSRVGLDVRELVSGNQAGIILGAMTTENTAVIGSRTASGNIAFQTFNGSSWGERMRIDYLGNVGIGGTPQAWNTSYKGVQVGLGANFYTNAGTPNNGWFATNTYQDASNQTTFIGTGYGMHYRHLFGEHAWLTSTVSGSAGVAATMNQLMTLDASGTLLVGTTSSLQNTSHSFKALGTSNSFWASTFQHDGTTGSPRLLGWRLPNSSDSNAYFVYAINSGGNCFNVFGNGSVTNSTGTYGTISDLRLKENISDARNYLADLLKLRVVKYSLKSEQSSEATKLGFIAQEVEQVFPTLVETNADDVKSIKTTVLIPMLLKALQELTARVQTLETR